MLPFINLKPQNRRVAEFHNAMAARDVGVPLTNNVQIANRSDSDHVSAIAVLAYTNYWDWFINQYNVGITDFLKPFVKLGKPDRERAVDLAAVVSFFAPMETLRKITDMPSLSEDSISIELKALREDTDLLSQQRGCHLGTRGVDSISREDFENMLIEHIIFPAGNGNYTSRDVWFKILDNIIDALKKAATPLGTEWGDRKLYRGARLVNTVYAPKMFLMANEYRFVSTSTDENVAASFSKPSREDAPGTIPWIMECIPDSTVQAIKVYDLLPNLWKCHVEEEEVLIVPGTSYWLTDPNIYYAGQHIADRDSATRVHMRVKLHGPDTE